MKIGPYLRLMRFHKPTGVLLLWFPTAWALWLANQGSPPLNLLLLFLMGTLLMRAAGCVINDIADRHVDLHVERTRMRPLVTTEVSLVAALTLFVVLLFSALMVLIQLPSSCFYYALLAVFIMILYPFCKRFIQGPQFVLGLAYSMGIPMAYAASKLSPDPTLVCLFIINFFWILSYDTQYAMIDEEDDRCIGVKSTAILFADSAKLMIAFFQIFFHLLWLILALTLSLSKLFFVCWFASIFVLVYQQKLLAKGEKKNYLQAFSSNSLYGLIMWLALMPF